MKVLHLDSSILGEASASRLLTHSVVDKLRATHSDLQVTHRDLGSQPLGHLTPELLATRGTAADLLNELQSYEARIDDALIAELKAADVIVIGAPLYNFTIPTGLKAWVDRVAVAGKTFRYTEQGPEGLVKNKKAIIVATSGGNYADTAVDQMHVGYLKQLLNFIGITDIEVVRASGLAMTEFRGSSLQKAQAQIDELVLAQAA